MVRAGRGGDGCVSFRREKYIPRGGPDGGDGGKGGDVYIQATSRLSTLYDFHSMPLLEAEPGGHGKGANRHGKNGRDLYIEVPCGTIVRDAIRGNILKDLKVDGETVLIAHGGRGGFGNKHFATSVNRAPRRATGGKPGEERLLLLELKLIADVGIVGLPNSGKSTLLSRVSNARPRVAPYPFTTLQPNLGVIELSSDERFVMADIPGLIEGAHRGAGLGDEFLRHIERTRLLLHLVDMAPLEGEPRPLEAYRALRKELKLYSPGLSRKPFLVVATKMDLPSAASNLAEFRPKVRKAVYPISAVTGEGLRRLLSALWKTLSDLGAKGDCPRTADLQASSNKCPLFKSSSILRLP